MNSQNKVAVLDNNIYLCEQQNSESAELQSLLLAKMGQ
jgi:hypothetical protein